MNTVMTMVGKAKRRMFLPVTGRWYESSLVSMMFSFHSAGGKGFLFYKSGLHLVRAGGMIGAVNFCFKGICGI